MLLHLHRLSCLRSAMSDYYNLLEVPRNASPEDIRRAYRRLALRWHPDKNPDNKAEAEARFKEISEAYEVLSDESRRRQYDIYGHGGHDADRHADYGSSRGGNAYHSTGAFAFTFRDPEELFREFFGSSDPFRDLFQGFHGGQRGATVFTGGFPFYQQNFGSLFRSGFIIDLDDLLFGQRMPTAGMGGVSAGFGTMPTQELTSVRYVNGKRIETRTIIQDGVKTVLCFEDGQLISRTVEGPGQGVYGAAEEAPPVSSREPPYHQQRRDVPEFSQSSLYGCGMSAQPSSATTRPSRTQSRAPAGCSSPKMSFGSKASVSCSAPSPSKASSKGGRSKSHSSKIHKGGKESRRLPVARKDTPDTSSCTASSNSSRHDKSRCRKS